MVKSKAIGSYFILGIIVLVGAAIRFANLEDKPLGIDEVITAIFSLGRSYEAVPTDRVVSLTSLTQLLQIEPQADCKYVIESLSRQSTHPPLFFCMMHGWLSYIQWLDLSLAWKLRAFSAIWGTVAIAAVYYFNRTAVSTGAGLMAAAIMAVSPFGVYLSQEARHYSLPVVIITLALTVCWRIVKSFEQQQLNWGVWISWGLINSVAFYLHYFCLISFIAQFFTLIVFAYSYQIRRRLWWGFIFTLTPVVGLIPWLTTLLAHFNSPKTGWLSAPASWVAPLYQLIIGWLLMVVSFPIESQALPIQIVSSLLMFGFGIWLSAYLLPNKLFKISSAPIHNFLLSYIVIVLIEFALIVYKLNKDITAIPRYNFIYYPAVILILGISLSKQSNSSNAGITQNKTIDFCFNNYIPNFAQKRKINLRKKLKENKFKTTKLNRLLIDKLKPNKDLLVPIIVLTVGLISSWCIVLNLSFKKPYLPELAAENFNQSPAPLTVVVGYKDTIHLSLGISYALALAKIRPLQQTTDIIFLNRSQGYDVFWQKLSKMPVFPDNIWIVAPGLKRRAYPEQIDLSNRSCVRQPEQYYRIGIPHQLYQCASVKAQ